MVLGDRVSVRLMVADPTQRKVMFETTASAPKLLT
jgi:hypothetical protein